MRGAVIFFGSKQTLKVSGNEDDNKNPFMPGCIENNISVRFAQKRDLVHRLKHFQYAQ